MQRAESVSRATDSFADRRRTEKFAWKPKIGACAEHSVRITEKRKPKILCVSRKCVRTGKVIGGENKKYGKNIEIQNENEVFYGYG